MTTIEDSRRRTLAGVLVRVLIMTSSLPSLVSAQDPPWAHLNDVPLGSRVRVTLRDNATNVTGRLVELRDDSIVMRDNVADRTHAFRLPAGLTLRDAVPFARAEVTSTSLVEIILPYRSPTTPNAAMTRRVLSQFRGRTKRLEVTYGANRVVGTISEVGDDEFVLKAGRKGMVHVRYAEVSSVKRVRMTKGGWAALGGVAGGLATWSIICSTLCDN